MLEPKPPAYDPETAALLTIPAFLDRKKVTPYVPRHRGRSQPASRTKRGPRWKSKAMIRQLQALGWTDYAIRKFTRAEAELIIEKRLRHVRPTLTERDQNA